MLESLEADGMTATFKTLKGLAQARYSRVHSEINVDSTYANRASSVRLFLDIAHEARHALTHRLYRPKNRFVVEPAMSKEAFVARNIAPSSRTKPLVITSKSSCSRS